MTTVASLVVDRDRAAPRIGVESSGAPTSRSLSDGLGRVAWSRGRDCLPVAEMLATGAPIRIGSDLAESCLRDQIDLLVASNLTSFDLVPTVVPQGVDVRSVRSITAAVSDGPHSPLVVTVADRLASVLGVPAEVVTVYRDADELPAALDRIERLSAMHPHLGRRVARASSAAGLTETLTRYSLLVVGAPGGSWFQRQLYGPGHQLAGAAPGGAIIVRNAPRRCFHASESAEGRALGPELTAGEARRLVTTPSIPVARDGRLVGVLRYDALETVSDDTLIGELMEAPVAVNPSEALGAIHEVSRFLDNGPVPVVDHRSRLVGLIHSDSERKDRVS